MKAIAITTALAALSIWPMPCAAKARAKLQTPAQATPPAQAGSRFYPQEIEGGVSGNYSFNNQIRKFRDPFERQRRQVRRVQPLGT